MKKSVLFTLVLSLVFFPSFSNLGASEARLVVGTGNTESVKAIAYSPDGRFVLSATTSALKLWEIASGLEMRTFTPKSGSVNSACFSPDGRFVLGASNGVEMWDIATGEKVRTFSTEARNSQYHSVAFSANGKYVIASFFTGDVFVWKAETGELIKTLKDAPDLSLQIFSTAALSPDGRYAASGGTGIDSKVRLWNVANGKLLHRLSGHSKYISSLTFSPDGRFLLSGGKKKIKLWEVVTGKLVRTFGNFFSSQNFVTSLAFSADGRYALSSNGKGEMVYWDVASGKELHVFEPQKGDVKIWGVAAISPDGKYAVHGRGKIIKLWRLADHKMIRELRGYSSLIGSLAFTPKNGNLVLSRLGDGTLKFWDFRTGREMHAFRSKNGYHGNVFFSSDGKTFFCSGLNGKVVLADTNTGKTIRTFQIKSEAFGSYAALSSDGRFVLSVDQRNGILWDARTGEKLHTLTGDDTFLNAVAFSPDSRFALTGGEGNIKIWDTASGRNVRDLNPGEPTGPFMSIAVSRDGRFVLAGARYDPKIFLWDFSSGKRIRVFTGQSSKGIRAVVFSPDGNRALSSRMREHAVDLWDVPTGKLLKTFSSHFSEVTSVAFSPDGRYGISGGFDGIVKIYDIARQSEIASRTHINDEDWVLYTGDGRFDGTPEGIRHLHFVRGLETFPLEAFYEKFYTPNLLDRLREEKPEAVVKSDINRELSTPPLVEILSPKQGQLADSERITLEIKVTDQGSGIDEVRLFQNGKLVSEATRGIIVKMKTHEEATHHFDVLLTPGKNEFKVVALNTNRTESKPAIVTVDFKRRPSSSASLQILAIGINKYKNTIYNLNFGRPDAEAITRALENQGRTIFAKIIKQEVYDEQAIKSVIEQKMDHFIHTTAPEDVFVFFYAGHGVMSPDGARGGSDFYLVTHDVTQLYGNSGLLESKGISARQLKEWLKKIPAQKQVVILDACQAGGAVESFALRGAAEQKAVAQLARSTGTVVLASSGSEQFASELPKLGHGLFTYALLQAISGLADGGNPPDGKITIKEIEAYINDRVPELTVQFRGAAQYPTSYTIGHDFPLAVK